MDNNASLNLSTGLTTTALPDGKLPFLRVTQINWFSGFRGSGLQVGDQIVAVDGEALQLPDKAASAQPTIGSYRENEIWAARNRQENDSIKLTVRRRATPGQGWQTLEVAGTLQAPVNVRTADNRILLGLGGPPEMYENDGFERSWREWADNFAKSTSAILDDPLYALALTSSFELENLSKQQPRVELLRQKYPGPFADAVWQDFQAMQARLLGPAISLPADALDYRNLGEQRADDIRQQAQAAWIAIQAELSKALIDPLFPAVHPVHGDRASVINRYAKLPPLRNRDWVGEAGRTWFVAGNPNEGWYFADAEGDEAVAMLDAVARYRRLVLPNIDESYELIGQVMEQPGQLVIGERAHFGLRLRPIAALIGGAIFVDLRHLDQGVARFAGEQSLNAQSAAAPPDSASPADVLQAMVAALKVADQNLWISLFATWLVEILPDGRPLFRANMVEQPARYFEEARRRIMERVVDMRPIWVSDIDVIISGNDYAGQQRLEEVTVEMQHIGGKDGATAGEFHPFSDVTVHRWWRLQRMGTRIQLGPWRITSLQPI